MLNVSLCPRSVCVPNQRNHVPTYQANINAKDGGNWTALTHAAVGGKTAMVKLLVAEGADLNAADELGFTARDMVPAESKPWELDPLAAPVRSPSKSMLDRLAEELTSQADDRVRERTPIRAR